MKSLILICSLLLVDLAWSANSTYFVTVPRIIFKNSVATATISVSSLPRDATVTIILKKNNKHYGRFSEVITSSRTNQIVKMNFALLNDPPVGRIDFAIKAVDGLNFSHSTSLKVKVASDRVFIQTDKPIYKPGEKIRFRIVGIDKDLKPLSRLQKVDELYVQNPSGSRMVQWTNITLDVGMESFELKLSTRPVLGDWKIVARLGSLKEEQSVKVEKYVLPKFELEILPPPYVLKVDKEANFKLCGKYTYGKRVIGVMNAKICLVAKYSWWRRHEKAHCITFNQKINGCTDIVYPLKKSLLEKQRRYYPYILNISAIITEDGTGIKQSSSKEVQLHRTKYNMMFQVPETFKPGFLLEGKLLITTPDGRPAEDQVRVSLNIGKTHGEMVSMDTVTVRNGVYRFFVVPENDTKKYNFNAHELSFKEGGFGRRGLYSYANAYESSDSWYSPTKRFVKIVTTENLNIGETAKVKVLFSANSSGEKMLNYLLICKGKNVVASSKKVTSSSTYLTFSVTDEMIPKCRMLVYYFHGEEFISDHLVVNFALTFKNKVSITFDADEKQPGEEVGITMKASPGSKIAVSAIDQSIMLLGKTNDIDENDIVSVLTEQDVPPEAGRYNNKCIRHRPWGRFRRRRSIMPWWSFDDRVDGTLALKETGVKYFTNADVDVVPCVEGPMPYWRRPMFALGMGGGVAMVDDAVLPNSAPGRQGPKKMNKTPEKTKQKKKQTKKNQELRVRKEFPETWLWIDEQLSSSGEKKITFKVPDTLTTWHANAFAMSPTDGIGVSKPSALKAFQPFFISLNLPYSVKRGEIVKVPATVFNYLDRCLVIGMTMDSTKDFTAMTSLSRKVCVCGGEGKTVKFGIKALKLGKIDLTVHARSYGASTQTCGKDTRPVTSVIAADALTKQLLVEAEGIKKEYSKSIFFCPNDNNGVFKETLSLYLPLKLVPGSVHAEMKVVGDLLGPSMSGLDKLLAMPYGCGEQNMLKFAPNVYIMDYLKASGQSDPAIESKAIEYMTSGYQRELTYRHQNGGYSAFGERDKEASTWLTAFVLRTYAQARRYTFIDPKEIELSKGWLLSLQDTKTGCFKELGMVHHKEMKGGVTGGITMTAFVLIALLEADLAHDDLRIKRAVKCMTKSLDDVTDSYTTAVLAFALKMAGSDKADNMVKKLDELAIRKDGLIHWEKESSKKHSADYYYYHAARSVDIEMTAYALMAYMGGAKPFGSPLDRLNIVKWMVKQRNSDGGFTSTQDTVVGLQALTQYSAMSFSGEFDLDVKTTESLPPNRQQNTKVTNQNKLVEQKFKIDTPLPFDLDVEAKGKGCALLQVNVKYNEPKPGKEESFSLYHKLKQDENSLTCRHSMMVCGNFTGKGKSNMALIDVTMVSGFEPIVDELDMQLQIDKRVPFTQYEFNDGVLTFYFNEFEQAPTCVEFGIEQVAEVADRKEASIKIYDYYDKDNEATKMYNVGKCPETNIVS